MFAATARALLLLILLPPLTPARSRSTELETRKTAPVKAGIQADYFGTFHALSEVAEAEPNDTPAQAQDLGCGNSLRPAALTNVGVARDIDWIHFTASVGELITFESEGDPAGPPETDTVLSLFASDGTTLLVSNDDAPGTFYSRISDFPAPYTGDYYGRILGFNGAQGSYRANLLCAAAPPPPANDRCDGAIDLAYGEYDLSGSTLSAANDYDLCPGTPECGTSCTGFYSPGRDVVYRLVIQHPGDILAVTYAISPASVDASLYVATDCGDVRATCVAGQDAQIGNPAETLTHRFATPGVYYLFLDSFNEGGGAWTLHVCLNCATAVRPTMTWGRLKALYR